ncbi:MAG: VOC family protein [Agarilytica sp.]
MSLTTTGIDHVNLQVNNLDVSKKFWKSLLGFELLEDIPEQKGVIIGNLKAKLALYENASLGRPEKRGFSHLCFHISDFHQAVSLCNDLSTSILYDGIVEWPQSKSLYIEDPNGYEIELTDTWGGALT